MLHLLQCWGGGGGGKTAEKVERRAAGGAAIFLRRTKTYRSEAFPKSHQVVEEVLFYPECNCWHGDHSADQTLTGRSKRSRGGALGSASRVTVPKDELIRDEVTAYKLVKMFGSDSLALDPNPATQAEESHSAPEYKHG